MKKPINPSKSATGKNVSYMRGYADAAVYTKKYAKAMEILACRNDCC